MFFFYQTNRLLNKDEKQPLSFKEKFGLNFTIHTSLAYVINMHYYANLQ